MAQDSDLSGEMERIEQEMGEALATKPWQVYLEASLGFRNHWYPALFSVELPEGEIEGLLAVRLHHARPRDVVNALRDLDLYDSGLVVPGTTLLVLRVRRGARQQAADAIANLDMP